MPTSPYRILGAEMSPFSVKVRSWFRYKGLEHRWETRGPANNDEFSARAKLPLVPLVVTPEDDNMQDSTPILERLEDKHPEPSILPDDAGMRFVSALLEEFGDEWGNKWMFHLRWARDVDQESAAFRLAQGMSGNDQPPAEIVQTIRTRMVPRVSFVGSNDSTAPIIEQSYSETLALLQAHLGERPYLLGSRPGMADFGLWGQLYNCLSDPTAGDMLRTQAPAVHAWVERMLDPQAAPEGSWETWESLSATLFPLLKEQVGGLFLPWSDANARALAEQRQEFEVTLRQDGQAVSWRQQPQKYHARSLAAIRQKYADLDAGSWCRGVLAEADCDRWLQG